MTRTPQWVGYLALALGFAAFGHLGHRRADNERFGQSLEQAYAFVPNGRAVRVAALGYHTMFADLLWVRSVLLFADTVHAPDSRSNALLHGMLQTVSTLDPHWRSPHFYGGGMLRVNDDIDASDEIYARGMAGLPDDPFFPFSLGMNAYLYRKDVAAAARYLHIAAGLPDAPPWYRAAAGGFLSKEGQTRTALQYLADQIRTADEETRVSLVRKYNRVLHDHMSGVLTELAKEYERIHGEPITEPKDLERLPQALTREIMPEGRLPPEPMRTRWILDIDGAVRGEAEAKRLRDLDQDSELRMLEQPWDTDAAAP